MECVNSGPSEIAGMADDPLAMSLSKSSHPWLGGGVEQEVEEVLGVRTGQFLDQWEKERMVSQCDARVNA